MNILLTAATNNEISTTIQWLKESGPHQHINIAVTGIGSTITAYNLTRLLEKSRPDLVVQAGIAGSYDPNLALGSTVIVKEDLFADLGAAEYDEFVDVFDLGLMDSNKAPFTNKLLVNERLQQFEKYRLPFVRAATINRISADAEQLSMITRKYQPAIESMEGAALHFVCLMENIPFLQIRSISNFAGERNKQQWKLLDSVKNLNHELKNILQDILIMNK